MRACTSSASDDHDDVDAKAWIKKLSTNLSNVLQADFSKSYLQLTTSHQDGRKT
jgi:hypothetical protein